MFDLYQI